MLYFYIFTIISLIISWIANRNKTIEALKIAGKRLLKVAPGFLFMLIFVSFILYLVPNELIVRYLGENNNKLSSLGIASLIGSISLMPGFIVFPLSGILKSRGVSYLVLAGFTTTLMMVGVLTFPLEKKYLGGKMAFIRNLIAFVLCAVVSLIIGIYFGEISL